MKVCLFKNVFVCLFTVLIIMNCSDEHENNEVPLNEQKIEFPDQESWNSKLVTTELGKLTAKIEFGYMAKYNERNECEFDKKIHVIFYDENGRMKSRITSDKGLLKENQKYMEVYGNVVAHSDSANMTLYTERLEWDETRNKILSKEFVTITTDVDTFYGVGFESDVDLKYWKINKATGRSNRPINFDLDEKLDQKDKK